MLRSFLGNVPLDEKFIIATETPEMAYQTTQLTDENADYLEREKVHQSVVSEQIET